MPTTVTPAYVARYAVKCLLATLLPTAVYAALAYGSGVWHEVVQWWQPWSDATLFATLTTVVHEGLYFGTQL